MDDSYGRYYVSKDYSEFLGPKHKSALAAQKVFWQNTFESVLAKHFWKCFVFPKPKHFRKCFALAKHFWNLSVGPVHPYQEKLYQRYRRNFLSRNWQLQENMESRQNLFFGAPSVLLPPFPPQSSVFQVNRAQGSTKTQVVISLNKSLTNEET